VNWINEDHTYDTYTWGCGALAVMFALCLFGGLLVRWMYEN